MENSNNNNVFKGCRKCSKGWIIDEITNEVEKCSCLINFQNKIECNEIIKKSNLPKISYTLDDYIGEDIEKNIPKLKKFISEFDSKFNEISIFVEGKNSCQKTTTIVNVGIEVSKKGFDVYYLTMQELLKILTNETFSGNDQRILSSDLLKKDLLIIDESFDINKVTIYKSNYQLPFLNDFLKNRIERLKKSTIFISNAIIDDIELKFDRSLRIMIERSCTQMRFLDNINLKNRFDIKDLWED